MKLIYKNPVGDFKVYKLKIEGYDCELTETSRSGYMISVPMGDNRKDKEMFDRLVYYNKSVYHSTDKEKVIKQVGDWIKNYKMNI